MRPEWPSPTSGQTHSKGDAMDDPHTVHALAAARLALAYHGLDIPAMKTAIRELCDADNHLRMTGHVPPVTGITAWDEGNTSMRTITRPIDLPTPPAEGDWTLDDTQAGGDCE